MRRGRAGFSVVEAVVAMAIAAIGLTAILSLQHQLAVSQARNEAKLHNLALRRAALTLIRDINPMAQASGQMRIAPGLTVSWTSRTIMPPVRGIGFGDRNSAYMVALYELTVITVDNQQAVLDQFRVERLGWQRLETFSPF